MAAEAFAPGDLCVVISRPGMHGGEYLIGRHVILLRMFDGTQSPTAGAPYWTAVGLPKNTAISHLSLRKIPPAPMNVDEVTEEELNV